MNFNVPNLFSLLRLGIVPFFAIALLRGEPAKALILFLLAGATDALDGWLARVFDQQSVLGAYLDPIADKLLLTTAYIVLAFPNEHPTLLQIPVWITVLVLARDLIIVVVALVLRLFLGITKFPPSKTSKVNTFFQVVAIGLVLVTGPFSQLTPAAIGCLYLVAGLTVLSGLQYIYIVAKMVEAVDDLPE